MKLLRTVPAASAEPPGTIPLVDKTAVATPEADREWQARVDEFDAHWRAQWASLTSGLSPISMAMAFTDWALNIACRPARASALGVEAWGQAVEGWRAAWEPPASEPPQGPQAPQGMLGWDTFPWSWALQGWRAGRHWVRSASEVPGMQPHHQDMVRFHTGQWMEMISPSNAPWIDPHVLQRSQATLGTSAIEGALHALDHWRHQQGLAPIHSPPPVFRPGIEVACTPGQVVFRNHLVELIQYAPTTAGVHAEPVFIVPSWILKYYILDLSPHNSLVRWMVAQGHTVFILSWRNPDERDADLSLDDYLEQGCLEPLQAIARIVPGDKVHACGYCLGGTLLSMAASAMARGPGAVDTPGPLPELASITLLAAETDFSEPGEMQVLIDEPQVALLEDMMHQQGFLKGRQMSGSFAYLRARDLVWQPRIKSWWLGEPETVNDLMAWNDDVTRMPARMHSQYLRSCYLGNELAQSRFPVQGRPVSLADIHWPLFAVGTEKDHVAPWRSVYKVHHLTHTDVTFVLVSAGHNGGMVSEPGHPGRHYLQRLHLAHDPTLTPDDWLAGAERHEGSWWGAWHDWLLAQGRGADPVPARWPVVHPGLPAAPGHHVFMRYND